MKISIIGGGAWGVTLAQVLKDNNNEPLIYDINQKNVNLINKHLHPVFGENIDEEIKATSSIEEAVKFTDYYLLVVGTKYVRDVLKEMNGIIKTPSVFINASKGIEPDTLKRVSEIVNDEINPKKLLGYVVLTGPSHAEDVIKRKMTLLVSASENDILAKKVQILFSNDSYMRVYTSNDVIGAELGGTTKNAIAVVSGILTGLDLGENARAALITRGMVEISRVVKKMGGSERSAFGLTGMGDLIVTASSENSRNFQAGKRIGKGDTLDTIYQESNQTIEGIRSIEALHQLSVKYSLDLPIINAAYEVIFEKKDALEVIKSLLSRTLKPE